MSHVVLKVENLGLKLGGLDILKSLDLELKDGMIACLLGASGCGKTTLLRCIAGFESVSHGKITINHRVVSSPDIQVSPEHRKIGIVFQDYALFPHLSVKDNIGFGIRKLSSRQREEKINHLLKSVDLEPYRDRFPHELSGGQQQRVALARALAPEPDLLLLDEPFSNLDSNLRERMKHELKTLLRHFGVTALMVTHNQDEAFDIADKIAVMHDGHILQWGSSYDLYHKPNSQQVARFLGTSAFIPARVSKEGCVWTELGELVCNEDLKTLEGKELVVLLRPDDIVHDDDSESVATVEKVSFRGMYVVYHLSLESGQLIHCFTSSHHEQHHVGDQIGIRLDIKHAVILQEQSIVVEQDYRA